MDILLGIIIVVLIVYSLSTTKRLKQTKSRSIDIDEPKPIKDELPIAGAYQKRWFFTLNEKDAYKKLVPIAESLGYTVFAKVRLLDLLEPVSKNPKYKTYFYKVQAKHVDFVLCDKKLVAQYIIELDDSTHDQKNRKERDKFVDEVVSSVGYKIIHTRGITNDLKAQIVPAN